MMTPCSVAFIASRFVLGGFRQRTVFTGGQSALLGGRACPEVAFLRGI
jgi:hypothetical protein